MILYRSITGEIQCVRAGNDKQFLVWREWPEGKEPGPWIVTVEADVLEFLAKTRTAKKDHVRARCIEFCWKGKRTGWYDIPNRSEDLKAQIKALEAKRQEALKEEEALLDSVVDAYVDQEPGPLVGCKR